MSLKTILGYVAMFTVILGGFAGLAGFGVVFHILSGGSEAAAWTGALTWLLLVAGSAYGEWAYGGNPKPRK